MSNDEEKLMGNIQYNISVLLRVSEYGLDNKNEYENVVEKIPTTWHIL